MTGEGENYDVTDTVPAGHSSDADTSLARRELGIRMNSALPKLMPRERVIFGFEA